MSISRAIRPMVDKVTLEVFTEFKETLMNEPVTYIIPAVWGAKENGEMTEVQIEINRRVAPVVEGVVDALGLQALDEAQEFAIAFIVRDLIVSKIIYMIESYKNKTLSGSDQTGEPFGGLGGLDPLGNA